MWQPFEFKGCEIQSGVVVIARLCTHSSQHTVTQATTNRPYKVPATHPGVPTSKTPPNRLYRSVVAPRRPFVPEYIRFAHMVASAPPPLARHAPTLHTTRLPGRDEGATTWRNAPRMT